MKNKRMVAKSREVEQPLAPEAASLGKDEVIDRLEEALEEVASAVNFKVGTEISILLFLAKSCGEISNSGDDELHIEGVDAVYASPLDAIESLTSEMARRLHIILAEADGVHMKADHMMCNYRKANPKIPISASVEAK